VVNDAAVRAGRHTHANGYRDRYRDSNSDGYRHAKCDADRHGNRDAEWTSGHSAGHIHRCGLSQYDGQHPAHLYG
jgi:hypothetical protein